MIEAKVEAAAAGARGIREEEVLRDHLFGFSLVKRIYFLLPLLLVII
jgi:hypothetical protein